MSKLKEGYDYDEGFIVTNRYIFDTMKEVMKGFKKFTVQELFERIPKCYQDYFRNGENIKKFLKKPCDIGLIFSKEDFYAFKKSKLH